MFVCFWPIFFFRVTRDKKAFALNRQSRLGTNAQAATRSADTSDITLETLFPNRHEHEYWVRVDPEFRATSWPSCSTLVGVTWPYGGALQNETSA